MNKAEQIERAIDYLESYDMENHEDANVHNDAIKICKESLEREKNEPLTLEQLKDMVGEPIYNMFLSNGVEYDGAWEILTDIDSKYISLCGEEDGGCYDCAINTYERTWVAYKYKKESD